MKDKDILKIIKKDIDFHTPELVSKITLKDIQLIDKAENKKQFKFNIFNFKVLIPITSFLLIGFLVLGLLYEKPTVIINEHIAVTNKDKIVVNYTTQALDLIDFKNDSFIPLRSEIISKNIDDFNNSSIIIQDYLNLINTEIIIIETSNKKHPYRMEVKTTNFFSETSIYTIEYFEERKEDEDEIEKKMRGIIIFNNLIFDFIVDQEVDAEESEIEITIKNKEGFLMKIEKEIEEEEYSLEYIIKYQNKNEIRVKFNVENDEMTLEIDSDGSKQTFEITHLNEFIYEILINSTVFVLEIDVAKRQFNYKYK